MTRWAKKLPLVLLVGFLVGIPPRALAAPNRCTLQVSPIVFPPYNPFSPFGAQAHGSLVYNCTQSHPIVILLGPGSGNSIWARHMVHGTSRLRYNLFLDAAGGIIWGDRTGGSQSYFNPAPPPNVNVTVPVYGRIPALQTSAVAGAYEDTVVVTLVF